MSNGRREEKKSQSANYRMILQELAPTDCGLGSVVPLMLSHTNQLCNRILQRKLKFLTPTVCQRVVVCFFFSESNSWLQRSRIFMALIQLLPVRGAEGEVCVWLIRPSSTCKAQLFAKCKSLGPLRHWRNRIMRRAHLSKYFIQPLKGTMKVYLYPAWSARYILAMIFSSPALETER